ncbi:MAG TPA: hypothetical protein VN200_11570 [Rhodoglobus sp.]|nr:hypothetical protein [Rhodoglobus sp.]
MAEHDDLRRLLADAPVDGAIDVDRVIARARRRRLPRRIAAGSATALAVVGVTVLGVQALQPATPTSTVMLEQQRDSAGGAPAESSESFIAPAPAEKVNGCQGAVAEVAPSPSGLELTLVLPPSVDPGGTATGEAVLTNASAVAVAGTASAPPAVTLSKNGVVVWHSSGLRLEPVPVQLAPGESVRLPVEFTAVECAPEHDGLERLPADLPPLPAGEYAVTALLDFTADDGLIGLVSGPAAAIAVP